MAALSSAFSGMSLKARAAPAAAPKARTVQVVMKYRAPQPVKPNSKPVIVPVHVREGDTVKVISGKDKGTVSTVLDVNRKTGKVVVKGVNLKTKHVKPRTEGETGQIQRIEAPMNHSKLMHYSKEKKVASRVGLRINAAGKRERYLKKTGEALADYSTRKAALEEAASE
uniref:KOW domain-containing protein n=2 Tax=Viridiplantae TaxID=33090 RepID=A0A7S3UFH6_9CHLO